MGENLRKVGRTDRESYVRVLLGNYREDMRRRLDRLKNLRRARGEILYINQKLDDEIQDMVRDIRSGWVKYRTVSEFSDLIDRE